MKNAGNDGSLGNGRDGVVLHAASLGPRGGSRTSGLPDFFIGAHAQTLGIAILTRDPGRYKTYFPGVALICP